MQISVIPTSYTDKNFNDILFYMRSFVKVSDVKYIQLSDTLSKFGGFVAAIQGIVFLSLSYFILKEWEQSIIKECQIEKNHSKNEVPKAIEELKNRISYKGIYNLYDIIEDQQHQINALTEQLKLTHKDRIEEEKLMREEIEEMKLMN